jgi:hypothetical protein
VSRHADSLDGSRGKQGYCSISRGRATSNCEWLARPVEEARVIHARLSDPEGTAEHCDQGAMLCAMAGGCASGVRLS